MDLVRRWRFEAFVVALAALEVATVLASHESGKAAAAPLSGLSALVLLGRRRQPLAATIAAFATLTVALAVMPHSTIAQFFGSLTTFAVAGAVNPLREAVLAWVAGAGLLAYAAWGDPFGGGLGDFLLSLAFGTVMWGAGVLVVRHRNEAAAMTVLAQKSVRDERARLARELHDVVSHGLSVVVVQTVAARRALADADAAETDRHLDAVESTARDGLAEMRRLLDLLQVDDGPVPARPSPGLVDVPQLIERAAATGVTLQVERLDLDVTASPGLQLSAYRVLQEALTNIVRHAPGASARIGLFARDGQLVVDVTNGRTDGSRHREGGPPGHGLVGLRERVALFGGTLRAGPTGDGGFTVRATFPIVGVARDPEAARP